MCEFLSWIESGGNIYFLTRVQVDSPHGVEVGKRLPGEGELLGHAAIRAYYELDFGTNKECTNFSTPDNFPSIIVEAIKRGDFRDFGYPLGLLIPQASFGIPEVEKAWADYDKALPDFEKARADYDKARADFEKALPDYEKALPDFEKARADFEKARADFEKARADYDKARADFEKALKPYFWDLFANPDNRVEAWR